MHKIELIGTILAGIILLSGCSSVNESNKTPLAELSPTPTFQTSTDFVEVPVTSTPVELPTEIDLETPIATAEVGIDQAKLHNVPASYESFLANPDLYVRSPYNPIDNPVEFRKWIEEQLSPALGDKSTREENFTTPGTALLGMYQEIPVISGPTKLDGQGTFFYFDYGGGKYPVSLLNVYGNDAFFLTVATIMDPERGNFNGTDGLQSISDGEKVRTISLAATDDIYFPDFWKQIVAAGFTAQFDETYNETGIIIGVGVIRVAP